MSVGLATEPDGGHSLGAVTDDGEQLHLTVAQKHVDDMVRQFQQSAIQHASKAVENRRYPMLTLTDVNLAHQGSDSELLASTTQMGVVVLVADTQVLTKLRAEIDRLLNTQRSPSRAAH